MSLNGKKSRVATCKGELKKKKSQKKWWNSGCEQQHPCQSEANREERERGKKKNQQGQRELWEKWRFGSFSAHPAERRCDSVPLPPNRPRLEQRRRTFTVSGAVTFVRRTGKTTPSLIYDVCLYICRFIYFFFTAHVRLIHTFAVLCQDVNNGNGQVRPVPDPLHTLAVPILSFLFTYLFILYGMKASGQEKRRRFTVVFMCVCVCFFCDPETLRWNEACPSIETH